MEDDLEGDKEAYLLLLKMVCYLGEFFVTQQVDLHIKGFLSHMWLYIFNRGMFYSLCTFSYAPHVNHVLPVREVLIRKKNYVSLGFRFSDLVLGVVTPHAQ